MLDADSPARLQRIIAAVQRRWGAKALRLAGHLAPDETRPAVATGVPGLDAALGIGGLPRGQMSELLGLPTSGMTTLALRTMAAAQAHGEQVGYLDPHATFDPAYAAWCGVDLATLLLIRPSQLTDMPDLLIALAASGGLGVLVVDDLIALQGVPGGMALLRRTLRVLPRALAETPCALVVLTRLPYPPDVMTAVGRHGSGPGAVAALRLHVAREAWLDAPLAPPTCRVRITVLRQAHAIPGASAQITLPFADVWSLR